MNNELIAKTEAFLKEKGVALENFALFQTLRNEASKSKKSMMWREWEKSHQKPNTKELKQFLKDKIESSSLMEFSQLTIEKGPLRAGPAVVETESPFVQMIQKHIHDETGINEFVHQYHGGSDIRLPILYGNCQCVGIGPSCNLPEQNSNQREWISADDYLTGIKILARILYHFQNFKTSE